jgi:hypothetical protein
MAQKRQRDRLASALEEGELPVTDSIKDATNTDRQDGTTIPSTVKPCSALEEGELEATVEPAASNAKGHDGTPVAKRALTTAPSASLPDSDFSSSSTLQSTVHSQNGSDPLNPPVVILPSSTDSHLNGITVYVIRDDVLPGGTKQRATALLFNPHDDTYVYAGPVFGFAQLALTVCANARNKHATVIVAKQRSGELHPLTARAAALGAHVVERGYPNRLKDIQAFSHDYVRQRRRTYLLPFGLDCEVFIQGLVDNLRVSLPGHLLTRPPQRLWLVAGSATLLAAFARLWPNTKFLVVQVGKTVWPDQIG